MYNYLGRDLYDKLDKIVDKAFHVIYSYTEENQYWIELIEMDYNTIDEDDDTPIITVTVGFSTKMDGEYKFEFNYNIKESDEFNIGYLVCKIEDRLNSDEEG